MADPAPRDNGRADQPLRVAVVGHCASGKTTLVSGLRQRGYDAYAVAQEHSGVATLWCHAAPDVLIYLQVPLTTVRERRGAAWSQTVYDAQETRLADARAHANFVLDTSRENALQAVAHAVALLESPQVAR